MKNLKKNMVVFFQPGKLVLMDYYKLDEKDIVILQTLAKDSRTKLSALAELLSTSIPTIKSRIDKLEALGIISFATKSRTILRTALCSSVNSKSIICNTSTMKS